MPKFCHLDVVMELQELCGDIINGIRHELRYYRASVYKQETAKHINRRVEQLRFIINLIGDDFVAEAMRDFDAETRAGGLHYSPGECPFFGRVTRLLSGLEEALENLKMELQNSHNARSGDSPLTSTLRRHRRQLLAMCRQGSRPWCFFQTL